MNIVLLVGPQAVGKMTVGKALSKRVGYTFLHNHDVIDLLLAYFPYGSPSFRKLRNRIRLSIVRELADSGAKGLVMTMVMFMNRKSDMVFCRKLEQIAKLSSGKFVLLELQAPLKVRMNRNERADRNRIKPRAVEATRKTIEAWTKEKLNSDSKLGRYHLKIENSKMSKHRTIALAHRFVAKTLRIA